MLWQYTRRDTKVLLLATLSVFSAYALLLAHDWTATRSLQYSLEAQSIGVFASVPATEENTLTMQLNDWENDLSAREAALARAEQTARSDSGTLFGVALLGSGLLGLILLNFYLDHTRRRSLV